MHDDSVSDPGDSRLAWDVIIDESNETLPEPMEMQIARTSGGINFRFERRRLPGVIARS